MWWMPMGFGTDHSQTRNTYRDTQPIHGIRTIFRCTRYTGPFLLVVFSSTCSENSTTQFVTKKLGVKIWIYHSWSSFSHHFSHHLSWWPSFFPFFPWNCRPFPGMGDRLVVVTNTENAAAGWRVENMGADFYDGSEALVKRWAQRMGCKKNKKPHEISWNARKTWWFINVYLCLSWFINVYLCFSVFLPEMLM